MQCWSGSTDAICLLHNIHAFSSLEEELKKTEKLKKIAAYIGTPGKGILAADESTGTIDKRLSSINVENVEENRCAFRELLFCAPGALQYPSGVILFEETLYQKTKDGKPFVDALKEGGVVPGIKVGKGTIELVGTNGKTATQGHDDLGKRCAMNMRNPGVINNEHGGGPEIHVGHDIPASDSLTPEESTVGQEHLTGNRQTR